MNNQELQKAIGRALSFNEVAKIIKNAINIDVKVVELNEMCNSEETIDEILDANNDCCILYIPVLSDVNGHYCSLFDDNKGNAYFCDSYGSSPRELLNIINKMGYVVDRNCLFRQMKEKYKACYMNIIQYQSQANGVASCGRFAATNIIFRHITLQKGHPYDLNTFYKMMLELNKHYKTNDFDNSVVLFTEQYLKK